MTQAPFGSTLGMLLKHLCMGTFFPNQKIMSLKMWAGEMAQQLRAPTALPEVLSSIPSNHMVAHNHL